MLDYRRVPVLTVLTTSKSLSLTYTLVTLCHLVTLRWAPIVGLEWEAPFHAPDPP